jgi:tetratricopeptide (TPR) repeat protein
MESSVVENGPQLFYLYADAVPAAWELLRGQRVNHVKFGKGVIHGISPRHFEVTFDQPSDERTVRTFQKDAFKGNSDLSADPLFTSLDIPGTLLDKIREMKQSVEREQVPVRDVEAQRPAEEEGPAGQGAEAAGEFLRLKEKHHVRTRMETPPPPVLLAILRKLEDETRLSDDDVAHLEKKGESAVLVNYYVSQYRHSHDGWDLAQASHWLREEGRPQEAISMTEGFNSADNRVMSAVLASRGGAFRALGQIEEAEQCCLRAIALDATRPHPYTLLGAIHNARGAAAESEKYFTKARELEAAIVSADKARDTEKI